MFLTVINDKTNYGWNHSGDGSLTLCLLIYRHW
jgi:hypothetical protein